MAVLHSACTLHRALIGGQCCPSLIAARTISRTTTEWSDFEHGQMTIFHREGARLGIINLASHSECNDSRKLPERDL